MDAFVLTASKIKSSLTPLGYSFLLIHESKEGRGRRWTATGDTRTKFQAEGGVSCSGIELHGEILKCAEEETSLRSEIAPLLEDILNTVEKIIETGNIADAVLSLSGEKSVPSTVSENGGPSQIPLGLTRLSSLVEDMRSRDGGDAFLFVEDSSDRNFWFGTGKLREMALVGEVGKSGTGGSEESIPNGDAEADETEESSERIRANLLDLGKKTPENHAEDADSRGDQSDDSDIEIIGAVAAPPSPPRGSSSGSLSDESASRSPSPKRPSKKIVRRRSDNGRSSPVYARCSPDDAESDDPASGNQKRKASSEPDQSEPAEKRRTSEKENKVGPKIFRVDEKLSGPKVLRKKDEGNVDGASEGQGGAEEETADRVQEEEEEKDGEKDEDEERNGDDVASSDGSDIEVIGTVSPPRRSRSSSRSSSRSRSRSRSRSHSRSPRGSRSPSPLFTRDFLYSGAPRISLEEEEEDGEGGDDSDIEDLTTTDGDDKLYEEEMGVGDGEADQDDDDKNENDGIKNTIPKKGASIECIDVDDED